MLTYHKKTIALSLLLVFILLIVAMTRDAGASGIFSVVLPENVSKNPIIAPPPLIPPEEGSSYIEVSELEILEKKGKIGHLKNLNKNDLAGIRMFVPDTVESEENSLEDAISFKIISSVEYKIRGNEVLVTLAQPSQKALEGDWVFGNNTIRLADGSQAFTTTNLPGKYENQIVYLDGEIIVTLASDMPLKKLEKFVSQVSVKN